MRNRLTNARIAIPIVSSSPAMHLDETSSIGHRALTFLQYARFFLQFHKRGDHIFMSAFSPETGRISALTASQQDAGLYLFLFMFQCVVVRVRTMSQVEFCLSFARATKIETTIFCTNGNRRTSLASLFDPQPALWRKPFLRQETPFVIHLARAPDPIAEVHVCQAHASRPRDVVEYHECS
jgi:hypothetical protein